MCAETLRHQACEARDPLITAEDIYGIFSTQIRASKYDMREISPEMVDREAEFEAVSFFTRARNSGRTHSLCRV